MISKPTRWLEFNLNSALSIFEWKIKESLCLSWLEWVSTVWGGSRIVCSPCDLPMSSIAKLNLRKSHLYPCSLISCSFAFIILLLCLHVLLVSLLPLQVTIFLHRINPLSNCVVLVLPHWFWCLSRLEVQPVFL